MIGLLSGCTKRKTVDAKTREEKATATAAREVEEPIEHPYLDGDDRQNAQDEGCGIHDD